MMANDPTYRNGLLREVRTLTGEPMGKLMRLTNTKLEEIIASNNGTTPAVNPATIVAPPLPAQQAPAPPPPTPNDPLGQAIAIAIQPYLANKVDEGAVRAIANEVATDVVKNSAVKLDEERVLALIEEAIDKAKMPRPITITSPSKPTVTINSPHFQLEELLYHVGRRRWAYLWGPPGSGKTTAAAQVAEALDLPFAPFSLTLDTPKSELFGFIGADGKTYRPTLFRRCWETGGVILIDEIDNMSPGLGIALNTAFANRLATFPDGMTVPCHEDTVIIASANTTGGGGDINHQSRRPLDRATMDRFRVMHWGYDEGLEENLVRAINPKEGPLWLKWVRAVREYTQRANLPIVASPRASMDGAEMLLDSPFSVMSIAKQTVFDKNSVKQTTRDTIIQNCPLPSFAGRKAI